MFILKQRQLAIFLSAFISITAFSNETSEQLEFSITKGEHNEPVLRADLINFPVNDNGAVELLVDSKGLRNESWTIRNADYSQTSDNIFTPATDTKKLSILINKDKGSIDRVYPSAYPVNNGMIVNLDYFILKDPRKIPAINVMGDLKLINNECAPTSSVPAYELPATEGNGQGRYQFIGSSEDCITGKVFNLIADKNTPQWIVAIVSETVDKQIQNIQDQLGVVLNRENKPLIYMFSDLSIKDSSWYRGDAGWKNQIFLRLFGSSWLAPDKKAFKTIESFINHELTHLWIGGLYKSADDIPPLLSEGAADYLTHLTSTGSIDPTSEVTLKYIEKHLNSCAKATSSKSLFDNTVVNRRAIYTCGNVLQWLADLVAFHTNKSSIWEQWRKTLKASQDQMYSWRGFIQASANPGLLSQLTDVLANTDENLSRWQNLSELVGKVNIKLELVAEDSKIAIRAHMLRQLLTQKCSKGRFGFITYDNYVVLDTEDRCAELSGNLNVRYVSGIDIFDDPDTSFQQTQNKCKNNQEIYFEDSYRKLVASYKCEAMLASIPQKYQIAKL